MQTRYIPRHLRRGRGMRYVPVRRYGFWNFVLDVTLTIVTSGLWIIWILVRELRESRW